MKEFFEQNKKAAQVFVGLASIITIFFVVKIAAEVKSFRFIGHDVVPTNTISVEGKGEVFAIPDIATVTYSVTESAKTVDEAQKTATAKINDSIDFLKKSGIVEKDIKTVSYNSYPKYDSEIFPPCYSGNCPARNPKIIGYEVSQTISVKIRNTDDAGKIIDGLGKAGVSNISGPDFTIEDEDALKAEARQKAIEDAKAKAKNLSQDLGVKFLRIIGFSESGNFPIYFNKAEVMSADAGSAPAPVPALPVGENKITSNVTITYEIK